MSDGLCSPETPKHHSVVSVCWNVTEAQMEGSLYIVLLPVLFMAWPTVYGSNCTPAQPAVNSYRNFKFSSKMISVFIQQYRLKNRL